MIRNRLLYFAILIVSAVFFLYTFNRITLMGLIAAAAFPPISFFLGKYSIKRLAVKQRLADGLIYKGGHTEHVIKVRNRSFLPVSGIGFSFAPNEAVAMEYSGEAELDLRPAGTNELRIKITGRLRGFYAIGAVAAEAYDILRLFKMKKKMTDAIDIAIYPRLIETDELRLSPSLISREQARYDFSMEDYEEISDVRQYRESDSIKKIHWKLSAKFQDWIVKNYQTNAWDATTVIPDRSSAGAEAEDRIIEIAVSIGYGILKRHKSVSLIYENGRLDANYMEDFENYYYLLALTEFSGGDAEAFPAGFIEDHLQGRNINVVVITSKPDGVSETVMKARDLGHNVMVAYVRPRIEKKGTRQINEALERAGVPFVNFELESGDLK